MYEVCYVFLIFFFYAILGYLVEVSCCSIIEKKLILNRGFCLGPYLPIYGISAVVMSFFLNKYKEDLMALFLLAAFTCTFIEYMTSLLLEKIFHARWWDYHDKKFNIEGRVCLINSIMFGLLGIICVKFLNPGLQNILNCFSKMTIIILGMICMIIFFTDVIITIVTLIQVKIFSIRWQKQDATTEINLKVKEQLSKNRLLMKHMLYAFPMNDEKNLLHKIKSYLDQKEKERKNSKK